MLLMGKSAISTGPFSIAMLNYQRVDFLNVHVPFTKRVSSWGFSTSE